MNVIWGFAEMSNRKVLSGDRVGKHITSWNICTVYPTHMQTYIYSAKIPSPSRSLPNSARRIQPLCIHSSAKTRWQTRALPCLWHWTVQSNYYIICSVCMHTSARVHVQYVCVCVYVCAFVVYACTSMWPSGECVACSHARSPDCKCCTCMWWLIATRHNRTLNQTKRRPSSYTWEALASALWEDLTGVLQLNQLQKHHCSSSLPVN